MNFQIFCLDDEPLESIIRRPVETVTTPCVSEDDEPPPEKPKEEKLEKEKNAEKEKICEKIQGKEFCRFRRFHTF